MPLMEIIMEEKFWPFCDWPNITQFLLSRIFRLTVAIQGSYGHRIISSTRPFKRMVTLYVSNVLDLCTFADHCINHTSIHKGLLEISNLQMSRNRETL